MLDSEEQKIHKNYASRKLRVIDPNLPVRSFLLKTKQYKAE